MTPSKNTQRAFFVAVVLVALTLAAFWNVRRNEFINFDDPNYVSENSMVQDGLTGKGMAWAFSGESAREISNWHPLTWISHMLDCEISGKNNPLKVSIHHSTSLFLHATNVLLLFLLFWRMTGALWRSAVIAAIFALHPLRVESVAWIAERKDVLSMFFGLLALIAYVLYVEQSTGRDSKTKTNAKSWYLLSLFFFALGLMSKPMLVTLPFVFLLLDFWPMRRWEKADAGSRAKGLLIEKLPFLALALVACAIALWAQRTGRSIENLQNLPFDARFSNVVIAYTRYIGKLFWPEKLAVFYPYPKSWPVWQVSGSVALVASLTFAAFKWARRWPFLFTGWFWFLGTLIPVIGIVQVGAQSMADRYTYLPMIGLSIVLVWGLAEAFSRIPKQRWILSGGALAALAACFFLTREQVKLWRNSETLYRHALRVTMNNFTAHENLGIALGKEAVIDAAQSRPEEAQHKRAEATEHFLAASKIRPDLASAHHNLGNAWKAEGKPGLARAEYLKATEIDPAYGDAYLNLGYLAVQEGDLNLARGYYAKAVELKPTDAAAQFNFGSALLETGDPAEAMRHYFKVLELEPNHVQALYQLGVAARRQGREDEAIRFFKQVLQLDPNHPQAKEVLTRSNPPN